MTDVIRVVSGSATRNVQIEAGAAGRNAADHA
jgi:hypothetical protein